MLDTNKDVVALIVQDHRDIQEMFARLLGGDGGRRPLLVRLAAVLTAHSRAEEAEVYPVIAEAADAEAEAEAVEHARAEHAEADELLAGLKVLDPDSDDFDRVLVRLIDAVSHHIEEEESTTLPALKSAVDARRLAQLADAFAVRRQKELDRRPV